MKIKNYFKWMMVAFAICLTAGVVACSKDDNENEPDSPNQTGRDDLSNTSWVISSMTGWGANDFSEFKGMVLTFGSKGEIAATYSDGYKDSGSYTLSGKTLNMTGMSYLTNMYGPTYSYYISGSQLTLVSAEGKNMETKFIFKKK